MVAHDPDSPSPPSGELTGIVAGLLREGRHEEAATLCAQRGDPAQAARILEKLWRFADALPLAERAGDRPFAIRLALDAKLGDRARAIAAAIPDNEPEELARAADAFAGRAAFEGAALMAERARDLPRAAELFRRAGVPVRCARLLAQTGKLREAAQMLENVAAAESGGGRENAEAGLLLGQILRRLGRPLEAVRVLQAVPLEETLAIEAQRELCGALLALGYTHAAARIARRVHLARPDLPSDSGSLAGSMAATAPEAVSDRFVVDRLLGGGSTGRVYLALDRLLGRTVALKTLNVGATGAEEIALTRFLREAEAAGRLAHPHIVALFDADPAAGLLVLEHLPGGSLADALAARGPLPLASARRLALEILDALAAAHGAGVVHRDVKPANIFFDAAGSAKLGDFGAAHLLDFGQTQTGGLIGTLAYLSPEQVSGGHIAHAADLYGMAATLFEVLTGRPPFLGPDFADQHLGQPPPTPSALRPDLPAGVDEVILKGLAKTPAERFGSANAMADAVRRWPVAPAILNLGAAASATPMKGPQSDPGEEPESPSATPLYNDFRELGVTARGRLLLAHDCRVDRTVVIEERTHPLTDDEIAEVKQQAARGGPEVQRVLALFPERRWIVYEHIEPGNRGIERLAGA